MHQQTAKTLVATQVCSLCKTEVEGALSSHFKVAHTVKSFEKAILSDVDKGAPDVEIGRKYGITFRYLEKLITRAKGVNVGFVKHKKVKTLEPNIDNLLSDNEISIIKYNLGEQIDSNLVKGKNIFCTEKYVEGVTKATDNKLKKFDLIIFKNFYTNYLFEINFYSTEGTKIGINQNEYIALHNNIKQNFKGSKFHWITDGNYWLTSQGEKRFLNLLNYFGTIYNINFFMENINNFK